MRVPVEWLKQYVTVRLSPEKLAERLTMAGLEVTNIVSATSGPVLELEVTPNRADCLSIIGVAREVAAMTGSRLKLPRLAQGSRLKAQGKKPPASSLEPRASLVVRIEDRKGCSHYIGRLIEGVRIGPSPEWMQRRLAACNIRAINNLVDITNYVLLEYGQPLHVFDFDTLAQGTIVVRRAQVGERLATLERETKALTADTLVIADAVKPVAVAGVMGGQETAVTEATSRVLLESAQFDSLRVRRTARALGLATESSYRFERGIDPAAVTAASERAAALMQQLAGGTERAVRDVGRTPTRRPLITVDLGHASRWLGTPLTPTAVRTGLARLGCRVAGSEAGRTLQVSAPSWRRDLVREVDVYEEIARLVGYDRLPVPTCGLQPVSGPAASPSGSMMASHGDRSAAYWRSQSVRCLCASLGLTEAITWALVSEPELRRVGLTVGDAVKLSNPLSQDYAYLRPSLLIGLMRAVQRNHAHGASGVRLFELGHVMQPSASPVERTALGIALSGVWRRDWRAHDPVDFFHLKSLLEALMKRLCGPPLEMIQTTLPWAQPGTVVTISLRGQVIGTAGAVARPIAHAWDVEHEVWYAELSVDALVAQRRPPTAVQVPSAFPSVKRDVSLVVPVDVPYARVAGTIREVGGALAGQVELIDRYTGKQLAPNSYSLTFSIDYRDPARTLTAEEVERVHTQIGRALIERLGATLR